MMMFASACLVCLFASSFAVPVQRSKAGDELLAALGQGTGAALGQATGDLLAHGVTTAIDTAVSKLTPLITKGITSALGFLGKREEDNAGDLLLQALGTSAGTALGTATGELAGDLLKQGVDKALAKGIPALTSGLSSALSHIHLGKRDNAGDLLLQALGTSAGTALGTATGELAGDLLKQGVDKALAKGIPALTSGLSSALSHIHLGKRDNAGDLLLQALGTSAGSALGTATGELAGDLLKQGVDKLLAKGIPALTSGLSSALSHIHLGKRNLAQEVEKVVLNALEQKLGEKLGLKL